MALISLLILQWCKWLKLNRIFCYLIQGFSTTGMDYTLRLHDQEIHEMRCIFKWRYPDAEPTHPLNNISSANMEMLSLAKGFLMGPLAQHPSIEAVCLHMINLALFDYSEVHNPDVSISDDIINDKVEFALGGMEDYLVRNVRVYDNKAVDVNRKKRRAEVEF